MSPNEKNRDLTHTSAPDDVDSLLRAHFAAGEELTPSSGFALSVMESLHAETSAPPPIPFPWRRVVPGLVAVLCAMTGFGVFALRELRTVSATVGGSHSMLLSLASGQQIHLTPLEQALGWIAMATCVSIAVVAGCMRLAASSSRMRV
jgi:hypothetical protein